MIDGREGLHWRFNEEACNLMNVLETASQGKEKVGSRTETLNKKSGWTREACDDDGSQFWAE